MSTLQMPLFEKCHNPSFISLSTNLDMNNKRKGEDNKRKVLVKASSILKFDALLHD
jgi:hypothetical protein